MKQIILTSAFIVSTFAITACSSGPKKSATDFAEATGTQPYGYTIQPVEASSLTQTVTFVANDATPADDVKAFAVLAAHNFCQKSGESAYVQNTREALEQNKANQTVKSIAVKPGLPGYKYDAPQFVKTENTFVRTRTQRVATSTFYCFDQANVLRGLKDGDKVLEVGGQEIENDEELRLSLNAAKTGMTEVKIERDGQIQNLNLLVADETPTLVQNSQMSLVAACQALNSAQRPSLCGPALQQAQDKSLVGQKDAAPATADEKKTEKK